MLKFIFQIVLRFGRLPLSLYFLSATAGFIVFGIAVDYGIKRMRALRLGIGITYLFIVFSLTIFGRTQAESYSYELSLFWSYTEIIRGNRVLLVENVLNCLMLIPFGILFPLCIKQIKGWQMAVVGILLSGAIEIMQLIMRRGMFDFDDIFHNVLGCMIGFIIYRVAAERKMIHHIVWNL